MDIASITKQQSLFVGHWLTSCANDSNASSRKPGSHSTELDHFRMRDGFGRGKMDLTYWYAFGIASYCNVRALEVVTYVGHLWECYNSYRQQWEILMVQLHVLNDTSCLMMAVLGSLVHQNACYRYTSILLPASVYHLYGLFVQHLPIVQEDIVVSMEI